MKLSFQLATISYCPDLTDPNAVSVPIAVLAVGKTSNDEGFWSAGIVGVDAKRMGIDPLSSAMLADVPHMIRRHVDGAMRRLTPDATPDAVLREFHESLKTSIHVSDIGAAQEVDVAEPRQLAQVLIAPSLSTLEVALKRHREALPRRGQWTPRVSPERLMTPAPEQMYWQPAGPELSAVA